MREVSAESVSFNDDDEPPELETLCSTPIPVLLHLCTETRVLALAHYELTFGRANPPVLRLPCIHHHPFSVKGIPFVTTFEGNEAEVAKYAPKIYFNFERDTVVFGRMLLPRGVEPRSRAYMASFPYRYHFGLEVLQKIENLGLSLNSDSGLDSGYLVFNYLNRQVGSGSFQRLKKLYLYLEAADLDLSRGVELMDFRKRNDKIAQKFVESWKTAFQRENVLVDGVGIEGVRIICKEGLSKHHHLRELLLKNGASPEEVLRCVWIKDIGRID